MGNLEINKQAFAGIYAGKKVLVTGNTGFKGSWLTLWLLELGAKVYGVSNDVPGTPCMFNELGLEKKIKHYWADIRNTLKMQEIVHEVNPDFVFHLAAQALVSISYDNPIDTISTNVLGTANLLEALRIENPECTAVIITSDKCYENVEWVWGYKETDHLGGKDIYSGSKGAAEIIIKAYFNSFFKKDDCRVRLVTARAGNVIGGGDWADDRLIPDFIRAISNGEEVKIRSPFAIRPWQHVLEPLTGYLSLAAKLYSEGVKYAEGWNFGPDDKDARNVEWITKTICEYWGEGASYSVNTAPQPHEANYLKLDCSKSKAELGWIPKWDIETTLKSIVDWNKSFIAGDNMRTVTQTQIENYFV